MELTLNPWCLKCKCISIADGSIVYKKHRIYESKEIKGSSILLKFVLHENCLSNINKKYNFKRLCHRSIGFSL